MGSPEVGRRLDYPAKALGVVLAGSVAHWLLAMALLSLMVPDPIAGQRAGLSLATIAVALVAFGVLYMRSQYSTPDHVARSIPWFVALSPPVAIGLLLPATLSEAVLSGPPEPLLTAGLPVLAAAWAGALMVVVVEERALRWLAVRVDPGVNAVDIRTLPPPPLAWSFSAILTTIGASMIILAVGVAAARYDGSLPLAEVATTCTGMLVLLGLAAAAGTSLGQSPGQDIVSIARRLDALGYGSRTGALDAPVVVTSFDEVGELLSRLEQLRAHLADEMSVYEDALAKTREADAVKSEFLSAVSHELRTPLNVVGGFAQLLLEGVPTPLTDPQAEDVRLIRAGGRQLLELINDILDMSMIESGELRLSFSPTNVDEIIDDVVQIHQPLVRDRGVVLEAECRPDLPAVVCDRRRLVQILTNLISNAIKFTEEGSITVRAAFDPRSNGVIIRCIDTGVGIEPGDLETIFEEYRQVGSLKRRKKGTGLGLAIARRIALAHGGSLMVESALGRGSTFTLNLPLDPPDRPETLELTAATPRQSGPFRTLPRPEDSLA